MTQIVYIGNYLGIVGGIERYMQHSAALLRNNGFKVHYLYTGTTARDVDAFSASFDRVQRFSQDADCLRQAEWVILHTIVPRETLRQLPEKKTIFFAHDHAMYCRRHHYYTPLGRNNCHRQYHPLRCFVCALGRNEAPPLSEYRKLPAIVLSDFMRDNLLKNGFETVFKLPAFIQTQRQKRLFMPEGTLRILFLGQLIRGKGADLMLRSLSKLAISFNCTVAGDGKDRRMLEKMVEQYGLTGKVTFTGFVSETEKLWQHCDIFCFPIRWQEPFGLVGLEAMAHGVPVVAFDRGGVREWLFDSQNGFCVNTEEQMTDVFRSVSQQPELLRRMGEHGSEIAEELFSEKRFIETFKVLCREVLK